MRRCCVESQVARNRRDHGNPGRAACLKTHSRKKVGGVENGVRAP